MAIKYLNKKKRERFWKYYEQAEIKDFRKVWRVTQSFISEDEIPFEFSKKGRKPNLTKIEYICMSVIHAYFDLDFRETEHLLPLLINKNLDHSNCVRWFGKLTVDYINDLVFKVHKKIIGINDAGDYIADSTKATCDRLKVINKAGEDLFYHITWKLHILVQYIFTLGLISIVSVWSSDGDVNDSPTLRNKLLKKNKIQKGKKCHADKGYFGKENIEKCKKLKLLPNIVPKEEVYSDNYLKKYVNKEYDNNSRKQNRGLVEGVFGGLETETGMEIRCRKEHHRDIYLCLLALKHNLRTYMRATLMVVKSYFAPTPVLENKIPNSIDYTCEIH